MKKMEQIKNNKQIEKRKGQENKYDPE